MVLEVGIPMKVKTSKPGEPDKFETILVKTQQGVDISTGLGQARDLNTKDSGDRKAQISEADAKKLQDDGHLMSGDKALAQSADAFAGQRVLGIGGGPTSEWAMEHAKNGGATSAEVAGAMPRPKKGSPEAAEASTASRPRSAPTSRPARRCPRPSPISTTRSSPPT